MKHFLIITMIATGIIGCNADFDAKEFNGLWRHVRVCDNGDTTTQGIVYWQNGLQFDVVPHGLTDGANGRSVRITPDSIVIQEICFDDVFEYEYDGQTIHGPKTTDFLMRVDSNSLTLQDYLPYWGNNLCLPKLEDGQLRNFKNAQMFFLNPIEPEVEQQHCIEDAIETITILEQDSEDWLDEDSLGLEETFLLSDDVELRFDRDRCTLADLPLIVRKAKLELEPGQVPQFVLFADCSLADSIVQKAIKYLDSDSIDMYQIGLAENAQLRFVFREVNGE